MSRFSGIRFHPPCWRRAIKRAAMWAFCHGLAPARVITFAFYHIDLREA
ncbi:hypothetical protein ACQKIE_01005 [Luteibacter sp. NPDC031894]